MEAASRGLTRYARRKGFQNGLICLHQLSTPAGRSLTTPLPTNCDRRLSGQVASRSHFTPKAQPSPIQARLFHKSPAAAPTKKFSYSIAASYAAKGKRHNPTANVYDFDPDAPTTKRREDRRTWPDSGQDAFFVSRVGTSGDVALGVADGVGGWADSGVDPADFSHGFCDYMAAAAWAHASDTKSPPLSARSLMQKGYEAIANDGAVKAGGSTACVGIAKEDGSLEVANLGDSGFVQLRLNAVHDHSDPQTHAFNTPYQLSIIPRKMRARRAAFGGEQLHDLPADAGVTRTALRHGDVLVFATDGVWDNLSSQNLLRIVSRVMLGTKAWEPTTEGIRVGEGLSSPPPPPQQPSAGGGQSISSLQSFLAVSIAAEAKAASLNSRADGPFAKEAQRYYPEMGWRGGKPDDICVVVAIVVEKGRKTEKDR